MFLYQSLCEPLIYADNRLLGKGGGLNTLSNREELFFICIAYFLLFKIAFKLHTVNKTSQAETSLLVVF